MSTRLIQSLIMLVAVISTPAFSNSDLNEIIKNNNLVTTSSSAKNAEREVYASLLKQWDEEDLSKANDKQTELEVEALLKQISVQEIKKQLVTKPVLKATPQVKPKARSQVQKRHVVKNPPPQRRYKTPSYKAPVNNIRYASLTGDYANNKQAHAFINKMVSKHRFDRGYLNYLLSNTEATPFLQKMAYKDAHGSFKDKKKKKPRAGRWNRYRGNFLTERTISKGIQFWKNNRGSLQRAEQQYGVPEEYILGIIGVETRYGGNVGKNRAIDALAAMGFNNPRRGKYFTSELEAYLLMTRRERLDPLKPVSSFAGALGLSQFMPSNIKRYAVDHDRDGGVNLWTPHDAIGSVANYFKKHGWKTGGTVAVPATSKSSQYRNLRTGFKSSYSLASLKNIGVSANHLGNISGKASLIKLNTYNGDELWLGGHNFYVITRYNHSTHYGMAVHQLAQAIKKRIGGGSTIQQASTHHTIESILRGN